MIHQKKEYVLNCTLPVPDPDGRILGLKPINNENINLYRELEKYGFSSNTTLIRSLHYPYSTINLSIKLLNAGADPNTKNLGMPILATIAERGHLGLVKILLDHGADVNGVDRRGITALMLASRQDDVEIIRELLRRGANINQLNNGEENALFIAPRWRQDKIAEELIKQGIDVTVINDQGQSVLDVIQNLPPSEQNSNIERMVRKKLNN